MSKHDDREHREQVALFQWAAYKRVELPELDMLFAIPNGGARNKTVAARLKAEGVKPGVPDVFLPVPRNGFHGLWIEMKAPDDKLRGKRKGTVTPEQALWISELRETGHAVEVCYGSEQAQNLIENYLNGDSHERRI